MESKETELSGMDAAAKNAVLESVKPVNLVITARSILAPKASVFIGTGDRQEKYATYIDNSYLPWLMAAATVSGVHEEVTKEEVMAMLQQATALSEKTFAPVISLHVLHNMASIANAIKSDAPYTINLNYRLPPGCRINVSKVLVNFVKKHEDFFLKLYAALHPEPKPVLTEQESKLVP